MGMKTVERIQDANALLTFREGLLRSAHDNLYYAAKPGQALRSQ
jgi:hypothetical protein